MNTPPPPFDPFNMLPLAEDLTQNQALAAQVERLRIALRLLVKVSEDAITEIRERSFARKPLKRALEEARAALEETP